MNRNEALSNQDFDKFCFRNFPNFFESSEGLRTFPKFPEGFDHFRKVLPTFRQRENSNKKTGIQKHKNRPKAPKQETKSKNAKNLKKESDTIVQIPSRYGLRNVVCYCLYFWIVLAVFFVLFCVCFLCVCLCFLCVFAFVFVFFVWCVVFFAFL